jgi:PncC family amidohydrolase
MTHTTILAARVIETALSRAETLATAESCTGGLLGHLLTNVPGASKVYLGGIIAYSNAMKARMLGVLPATLAACGAVSEATALAMATGAREQACSDWAIAVTGIAGPGGGTAEKPVGLVYVAVAGPRGVHAVRHDFEGERAAIKTQTAEAALQQLLEAFAV